MFYFESSAIHGAAYDTDTRTLFIQFVSGAKIYEYPDVPEHVFGGLLAAESKGQYYASYIRDRYIPYN